MTAIKLCGLKEQAEIELVNELKPDKVGFMLYQRSKRYCPLKQLRLCRQKLDPGIAAVGVAVDAPPFDLVDLVAKGLVSELQLHGHEDAYYVKYLRTVLQSLGYSVPLAQAFAIKTDADLKRALASSADVLLLDAVGGGSGQSFDWSLLTAELRGALNKRPWFLAGGLNPENVAQAVVSLQPYGVDVSSGLETPPGSGHKDLTKMRAFCAAVRAADTQLAPAADGQATQSAAAAPTAQ